MGLSSSQGRLLMLTSRLSDIELSEILISQRQNQLAWESEKVAKEYNDAVSNYKIVVKIPDSSETVGFKREDLSYTNMSSMGYLVTDANDNIYLTKDENGKWVIPKDSDGNSLVSSIKSSKDKDGNETTTAKVGNKEYSIKDGTNYLADSKTLQNSIINGVLFIFNTNSSTEGISISNLEAETDTEYVLDTSDDAEAQSKYEYESARISRQDNQLDMELKQLETQHEAISKEYDSVKDVINNNIDRTFKLFSNG